MSCLAARGKRPAFDRRGPRLTALLHAVPGTLILLRIVGLALPLLVPAPGAANDEFTISARRAAQPPRVDGHVGDAEWRDASRADTFLQYQPRPGAPADLPTVALVLYDDTALYVAFRVWDPEPPIEPMTQRDDPIWNDDSVQVYIDSFHDRRSGYYFMTNVLGTQADGRIAEDGGASDGAWDAPWRSVAVRTDYGWSAEFAIPLTSLQYVAGASASWGINFSRSRRRTLERTYWAGPVDHWARMSLAGTLTGLDIPQQSRRHQIIPYALARVQEQGSPYGAVGLDGRYALTPQLSAYGTVNPDFATIEADQELVNLTRFEVSLPEKRQFFLEGGELFGQRIRTFYSRRIADIQTGGKILGKQGPWAMHLLATRGSRLDAGHPTYAVARVQRDVAARSTVGVLFANRTLGGRQHGSIGGDASLYVTDTVSVTGQFVHSYGTFDRGTTAFFVRPSYDSATAHAHVGYTHLGDRVADNINGIGFILDDDRREIDAAASKTLWPAAGPVERLQYDSAYDIYWGQTGTLRSWQVDESVTIDFRNRWSVSASHTEEFKRFEKDFRNRQTGVELGYNTRAYQSVQGGVTVGRNFDADFVLARVAARRKLTDRTSAEYELQRLSLTPDLRGESTWIHVVRASQFFTPDLFLTVFYQTNAVIDRRNLQAVFVYRYLPPFGTLQVAYQRGTAEFGQRSDQGHTLFVKIATVL